MEKTDQELIVEAAAEAAAAVIDDIETAEKIEELESKTENLETDNIWSNEQRQQQWIKIQELESILTHQTEMMRALTGMIAELQKQSYPPPEIENAGVGDRVETLQEEVEKVEEMEPEPEPETETEIPVAEEVVRKSRWI